MFEKSSKRTSTDVMPEPYEIRIQGLLDPGWSEWLESPKIIHTPAGETILTCLITDQTALHGLLMKIRDMNLKIISINLVSPETVVDQIQPDND